MSLSPAPGVGRGPYRWIGNLDAVFYHVGLQLTVPENCFVLLSDGFDSYDSDDFYAVCHLLTIGSTAGWQPPLNTSFYLVYWRQFWCLLFLFYSGNGIQMKHSFLNCFNFLSLSPICCWDLTLPDYCWFSQEIFSKPEDFKNHATPLVNPSKPTASDLPKIMSVLLLAAKRGKLFAPQNRPVSVIVVSKSYNGFFKIFSCI